MKTKTIVLLLVVCFFSCKPPALPERKGSYVHSVIDSLEIDTSKNILIYTININDCTNCFVAFTALNNALSAVKNPKVIVLTVAREIEKEQARKTLHTIDLRDTVNKVVLWNKAMFIEINKSVSVKKEISLSALTIYNHQKDSILYNKPVKEIRSIDEFSDFLEK